MVVLQVRKGPVKIRTCRGMTKFSSVKETLPETSRDKNAGERENPTYRLGDDIWISVLVTDSDSLP